MVTLILLLALFTLSRSKPISLNGTCKGDVKYKLEINLDINGDSGNEKFPVGPTILAVHTKNFSLFKVGENLTQGAYDIVADYNASLLVRMINKNESVNDYLVEDFKGDNFTIRRFLRVNANKEATYVSVFGGLHRINKLFFGIPAINVCQDGLFVNSVLSNGTKLPVYEINPRAKDGVVTRKSSDTYGNVSLSYYSEREKFNPNPKELSTPKCFPADSKVTVRDGQLKRMDELQIGERVAVGGGKFSEVFMFTHKLKVGEFEFVAIRTDTGNVIRLTPGHYLPLNGMYLPASDAKIGDMVRLADDSLSRIVQVRMVTGVGLFNPQTKHGDIVVDGVRASTFTNAVQRNMAHAMLAPLRLARKMLGLNMNLLEGGVDFVTRIT